MSELNELRAEVERLRRGGAELGKIVKANCDMVLDATGLHDWIGEDGDGDWAAVWENLAELRPRAEAAEAALARVKALAWSPMLKSCGGTNPEDEGCFIGDLLRPLRALLAPSPAATIGEADAHDKDCESEFVPEAGGWTPCRCGERPAPVSSGEGADGNGGAA